MSRFDLLMFDLDGTLLDTKDDLTASVNALRVGRGLPEVSVRRVVGWVGDGAPTLVARALGIPEERADRSEEAKEGLTFFRRHYVAHMLDQARPYPGVRKTLARLGEQGIALAVVSNKPVAMCEAMLDALDLRDPFFTVLGGDSQPDRKPHPAPLVHVLERRGVPPGQAAMIGDGAQDMIAGRAAGVTTVAALWGFREREELEETEPDHWVESMPELLGLV